MNQITQSIATTADATAIELPGIQSDGTETYLTPAGLQDARDLARRRVTVLALNLLTLAGLSWLMAQAFSAGGWAISDIVIFVCFPDRRAVDGHGHVECRDRSLAAAFPEGRSGCGCAASRSNGELRGPDDAKPHLR